MKNSIFIFLILVSCVSAKIDGYIKTKDGDKTEFKNSRIVYLPTAIWVIKPQSEISIDKKNIKEIYIIK